MSATQELIKLDPTKRVVPFFGGANHQFSHSDMQDIGDPTGISIEEGEFLYGLIRLLKPINCLETGTNIGVSASYICLGLRDNGVGRLDTIEHSGTVARRADAKLSGMGFSNFSVHTCEVANYNPNPGLDFLWLDSELNQRYNELVRFFPLMNPGAVACIHDLWSIDFDQFAPIPIEMLEWIKTGELRALTFSTPHGVTVFQKRRNNDFLADLSKLP